MKLTHEWCVHEAIGAYDGVWPEDLYSGVMFWKGDRITRSEFEKLAKEQP